MHLLIANVIYNGFGAMQNHLVGVAFEMGGGTLNCKQLMGVARRLYACTQTCVMEVLCNKIR